MASDKTVSLKAHLERVKNQMATPSPRHEERGCILAFQEWCKLEIKRTQVKIDKLEGK